MHYMNLDRTTDNWKLLSLFNEKDTIIFCLPDTRWFWIILQMVTVLLNTFHIAPKCLSGSITDPLLWCGSSARAGLLFVQGILTPLLFFKYQYLNVFPLDLILKL